MKKILFSLLAISFTLSTYASNSGSIELSGTVEKVIDVEVQNQGLMDMMKAIQPVTAKSTPSEETGEEGEEIIEEPVFHELTRMTISSNSLYNINVAGLEFKDMSNLGGNSTIPLDVMLEQNGDKKMMGSKTNGSSVTFNSSETSGDDDGVSENIFKIKPQENFKDDGKIWVATISITLAAD